MVESTSKCCGACGAEKPLIDFNWFFHKGTQKKAPRPYCRSCDRAYFAKYRAKNREKIRKYGAEYNRRTRGTEHRRRLLLKNHLAAQFGLTLERFAAMLDEQGGKCAICGDVPAPGMAKNGRRRANSRLCVDHDHVTGAVRSLLCQPCNTAIGMLRDDPERCIAAAAYLRRHRDATPIPAESGHEEVP